MYHSSFSSTHGSNKNGYKGEKAEEKDKEEEEGE